MTRMPPKMNIRAYCLCGVRWK